MLCAESVVILPQKTNFDLFVDAVAPTAPVAPTPRSAHAYLALFAKQMWGLWAIAMNLGDYFRFEREKDIERKS